MTPYTLQSHEAIARWDEIELRLKSIESPGLPLSVVQDMVRGAQAQVWCVGAPIQSVCLTQIISTPDHKYGVLWGAAGERSMAKHVPVIEAWMRDIGCKYVELNGRRGWKKLLPDYRETQVKLVKELT